MRRFLVACVALVLLAVPAVAEDGIGEEVLPDDTVSVPVVDIPPSDDVLEDLPVDSEEDTPPVVDEVPPGDGEEVPPETLPPVEDIPPVDEVPLEDGEAGSPPEDIPEDDLDSVTLSDIYRLLSDSGQFEPSRKRGPPMLLCLLCLVTSLAPMWTAGFLAWGMCGFISPLTASMIPLLWMLLGS